MFEDLPSGEVSRFRPKTVRQFLIFHIAWRLDDLRNLGRHMNTCIAVPKAQLVESARSAEQHTFQNGSHAAQNFWELIAAAGKEIA
jgi:hypothetical protein